MFEKKGTFVYDKSEVDEEKLMEYVLDAGSEDISEELEKHIEGLDKPVLSFQKMEDMEREYLEFYQTKCYKISLKMEDLSRAHIC